MNADLMPELLAMFRRRGYTFISLNRALADEAYQLPEKYVGRGGFSWMHRWSMTKGMGGKGEPDAPKWVEEAFAAKSQTDSESGSRATTIIWHSKMRGCGRPA